MPEDTATPDAVRLTQRLVAIPSEASDPTARYDGGPEARILEALKSIFEADGIDCELQPVLPGRSNLVARFPSPGRPKILISGHMDTVSARGMDDPFSGALSNGRIRGRGACDDKGPLASVVAPLLALHRRGEEPSFDVTFTATVDEEQSMAGAAELVKKLGQFDLCVVLEPTLLRPIHAHKGFCRLAVVTRGQACHSAEPTRGRNAILEMTPVIRDLEEYGTRLAAVNDPELGHGTLAVTGIRGGTAINIIPDRCELQVDVRTLPDVSPDDVLRDIEKLCGRRAEVRKIHAAGGMRSALSGPAWERFREALRSGGIDPTPGAVHYCTDCAHLKELGPCVVWGPGDIGQAHSHDEFIAVDQIRAACEILSHFLSGAGAD